MSTSRPDTPAARLRSVTRRVRVAPGATWWACLVVLPVLLSLACVVLLRDNVQDSLQQRVDRKTSAAGWSSARFDVEGRDVTAHVPASVDRRAVQRVIKSVDGVRSVKVTR